MSILWDIHQICNVICKVTKVITQWSKTAIIASKMKLM